MHPLDFTAVKLTFTIVVNDEILRTLLMLDTQWTFHLLTAGRIRCNTPPATILIPVTMVLSVDETSQRDNLA